MNFDRKNRIEFSDSQERIELIKRRIAEKYYDREDVLFEVAKRILDSNDLDEGPGRYSLNLH